MRVIWSGLCLAFLASLAACSKSSEADKLPPMEVEGVNVDTPRLMAEFVNASPELQRPVNEAVTKIRYKQYLQAMMGLDEVLKRPDLNDKQKKLVAQVIDQLKEVIAKAPPRPI
jgi:cell pole-organizing protein PopZ